MNPSEFLDELENIKASISAAEGLASHFAGQGQSAYSPIAHELAEAWDAVDRAVEVLNENAGSLAS
jgi:hypothetical protein